MNKYQDEVIQNRLSNGYDEDPNEITISLKNVWRAFKHDFWVILLCMALCGAAVYGAGKWLIPPKYQTQGIIYIEPKEMMVDENGKIGTFDKKIINNAMYISQNEKILQDLVDNTSYEKLKDIQEAVQFLAYGEADMLQIDFIGTSAQEAYDMANLYLKEDVELLKEQIPYANISVIQAPQMPEKPINEVDWKYMVIGAFLGLVFSSLWVAVKGLKDTRMLTREEAEAYLEKPVYAVLPAMKKKKGGK